MARFLLLCGMAEADPVCDKELAADNKEYDYVINNDLIIIDLSTDTSLSENTKKSIAETIKYNMDINNIQIQGLNQVLLEVNENTGL